jgi:alkylhydroperoxidase family enzyme
MLPPDPEPRLPPIAPEQFTDETRQFFDRWSGGFFKDADKHPVLRTFAHHPMLADLFSQLNVHLLTTNTMPVKQRQIAIMRAAWITDTAFMWSSHLNTSVMVGLSPDMFGPLQVGADDPYFTDFERTVIRATEDLVARQEISTPNWDGLMMEWNNQQMLDFIFTVGTYVTVACVMKSTRIQRMPDLLDLAARYGAPLPAND